MRSHREHSWQISLGAIVQVSDCPKNPFRYKPITILFKKLPGTLSNTPVDLSRNFLRCWVTWHVIWGLPSVLQRILITLERVSLLLHRYLATYPTSTICIMTSRVIHVDLYEHPWIARVSEMRSSAAINVDAELKVSKLNEEIRELVKEARAKVGAHMLFYLVSLPLWSDWFCIDRIIRYKKVK